MPTQKQQKKNPRISLCIPNYNRGQDLLNVVADCMNQTVAPYEIIILDDRSSAEELRIIKKGLKLRKNMSFEINKKNLGLAGNVNAVIMKARGDYLAVINNDDRISKYYVKEIVNAVAAFPEYNVYTTNAMGMNEKGEVVGDLRLANKSTVIHRREGIKKLWHNNFFSFITISGTSFYKTGYIKQNLFEEKLGNEADLDTALHILSTEDVMYIDKPVYYVRMHADQESTKIRATSERLVKYVQKCLQIYGNYAAEFNTVPMYLTKLKGLYFLQLSYKYRFNLRTIRKLLRISTNRELLAVILTTPILLARHIRNIIAFKLYYKSYAPYFPEHVKV